MRRRSQEEPGGVWRRRGRCDGRSGGSRESQARIGRRRAQAARGLKGFFPPSRLARGRGRGRDATGAKHGRALDTRPPSRLPSPTLTLRPTSDPAEHPRGSDAAEGPFSALVRPYQACRAFPLPPFSRPISPHTPGMDASPRRPFVVPADLGFLFDDEPQTQPSDHSLSLPPLPPPPAIDYYAGTSGGGSYHDGGRSESPGNDAADSQSGSQTADGKAAGPRKSQRQPLSYVRRCRRVLHPVLRALTWAPCSSTDRCVECSTPLLLARAPARPPARKPARLPAAAKGPLVDDGPRR